MSQVTCAKINMLPPSQLVKNVMYFPICILGLCDLYLWLGHSINLSTDNKKRKKMKLSPIRIVFVRLQLFVLQILYNHCNPSFPDQIKYSLDTWTAALTCRFEKLLFIQQPSCVVMVVCLVKLHDAASRAFSQYRVHKEATPQGFHDHVTSALNATYWCLKKHSERYCAYHRDIISVGCLFCYPY